VTEDGSSRGVGGEYADSGTFLVTTYLKVSLR